MTDDEKRTRLGELADRIEGELRALGVWQASPPSEEAVLEGGAFGQRTVPFELWLQVILVRRLRQVATGEIDIPSSSEVSTYATREWDGRDDCSDLLDILYDLDDVVG